MFPWRSEVKVIRYQLLLPEGLSGSQFTESLTAKLYIHSMRQSTIKLSRLFQDFIMHPDDPPSPDFQIPNTTYICIFLIIVKYSCLKSTRSLTDLMELSSDGFNSKKKNLKNKKYSIIDYLERTSQTVLMCIFKDQTFIF